MCWMFNHRKTFIKVGLYGCKSITVVMENGQMAGVPWAYVEKEDGTETKHNLALCESIIY